MFVLFVSKVKNLLLKFSLFYILDVDSDDSDDDVPLTGIRDRIRADVTQEVRQLIDAASSTSDSDVHQSHTPSKENVVRQDVLLVMLDIMRDLQTRVTSMQGQLDYIQNQQDGLREAVKYLALKIAPQTVATSDVNLPSPSCSSNLMANLT